MVNRFSLFLIPISALLFSCTDKRVEPIIPNDWGWSIHTVLTQAIDTSYAPYLDSLIHKRLCCSVALINKTDSMKCFWIMTNHWEMNWACSDSNFIIYPEDNPYANFPMSKKIMPHDSMKFEFNIIAPLDATLEAIRNLRFGFKYFEANSASCDSSFFAFKKWIDDHNIAAELDAYFGKRPRTNTEIMEWAKAHKFKEKKETKIIWEK